jgi:hypothetical protein
MLLFKLFYIHYSSIILPSYLCSPGYWQCHYITHEKQACTKSEGTGISSVEGRATYEFHYKMISRLPQIMLYNDNNEVSFHKFTEANKPRFKSIITILSQCNSVRLMFFN